MSVVKDEVQGMYSLDKEKMSFNEQMLLVKCN